MIGNQQVVYVCKRHFGETRPAAVNLAWRKLAQHVFSLLGVLVTLVGIIQPSMAGASSPAPLKNVTIHCSPDDYSPEKLWRLGGIQFDADPNPLSAMTIDVNGVPRSAMGITDRFSTPICIYSDAKVRAWLTTDSTAYSKNWLQRGSYQGVIYLEFLDRQALISTMKCTDSQSKRFVRFVKAVFNFTLTPQSAKDGSFQGGGTPTAYVSDNGTLFITCKPSTLESILPRDVQTEILINLAEVNTAYLSDPHVANTPTAASTLQENTNVARCMALRSYAGHQNDPCPAPSSAPSALTAGPGVEVFGRPSVIGYPAGVTAPVPLNVPDQSPDGNYTGTIEFQMTIGVDGVPSGITITKQLGSGFIPYKTALAAANAYRFKPAIKNGQPIAVQVTYRVYHHGQLPIP